MASTPAYHPDQCPDQHSKILLVDDDPAIRAWCSQVLTAQGYSVQQADSGAEALTLIADSPPHLLMLDVLMPGLNGFEVTGILKQNPLTRTLPVMLVTSLSDPGSRMRGLEAGADEFISKPVDVAELIVRVRNLLRAKLYADELAQRNLHLETQVEKKTQVVREHCIDTVLTLMRAAEYRDETTGTHVERISHYCRTVSEQLGLDHEFCEQIYYASPMHDIGKLAIPDAILNKSSGFNAGEWSVMQTHTLLGQKILAGARSPYLRMGAEIALNHHEHWDGGGYPHNLKHDQIPLSARIMAVCDVYDALRSERPYKGALSHQATLDIMCAGDGKTRPEQFDPEILQAFLATADHCAEIYQDCKRARASLMAP